MAQKQNSNGVSRLLGQIRLQLQTHHFGRDRISFWLLLLIFVNQWNRDNLLDRASAVAFNLTFALFPFVIFLFTLLPYLPIENMSSQLLGELKMVLPESLYTSVHFTISDTLQRQRGDLLSFGFISAMVLSTNGMMAFMGAFNISLRKRDRRSYLKQRGIAMGLTFLLIILILLGIFLIVTGELILAALLNFKVLTGYDWLYYSIDIMRYVVTLVVFFFAIVAIYFFGPAQRYDFRHQALGAAIATVFITIASVLFAMYLQYFDTYNKLYGSIGTFIGVMFWFLAISLGILMGFELNVSLARARKIARRAHKRIEGKL